MPPHLSNATTKVWPMVPFFYLCPSKPFVQENDKCKTRQMLFIKATFSLMAESPNQKISKSLSTFLSGYQYTFFLKLLDPHLLLEKIIPSQGKKDHSPKNDTFMSEHFYILIHKYHLSNKCFDHSTNDLVNEPINE